MRENLERKGAKKMETVKITVKKWYYVSWSPRTGEATYGNCFETEEKRSEFISRISKISISIHTWENEYLIEAE